MWPFLQDPTPPEHHIFQGNVKLSHTPQAKFLNSVIVDFCETIPFLRVQFSFCCSHIRLTHFIKLCSMSLYDVCFLLFTLRSHCYHNSSVTVVMSPQQQWLMSYDNLRCYAVRVYGISLSYSMHKLYYAPVRLQLSVFPISGLLIRNVRLQNSLICRPYNKWCFKQTNSDDASNGLKQVCVLYGW